MYRAFITDCCSLEVWPINCYDLGRNISIQLREQRIYCTFWSTDSSLSYCQTKAPIMFDEYQSKHIVNTDLQERVFVQLITSSCCADGPQRVVQLTLADRFQGSQTTRSIKTSSTAVYPLLIYISNDCIE